jgi:hypothetical protein
MNPILDSVSEIDWFLEYIWAQADGCKICMGRSELAPDFPNRNILFRYAHWFRAFRFSSRLLLALRHKTPTILILTW